MSWLTAMATFYRAWAPVIITYLCLFLGLLSLEIGSYPGTIIGLDLLATTITYSLYVLINLYQRWVRSVSTARFAFLTFIRLCMYASHVLLIYGGTKWMYYLGLVDTRSLEYTRVLGDPRPDFALADQYYDVGFQLFISGGVLFFISTTVFVTVGLASDEDFAAGLLGGVVVR